MQKWEYLQGWYYSYMKSSGKLGRAPVPIDRFRIEDKEYEGENIPLQLNYLGKQGWELIEVTPWVDSRPEPLSTFMVTGDIENKTHTKGFFFWFKRPIED